MNFKATDNVVEMPEIKNKISVVKLHYLINKGVNLTDTQAYELVLKELLGKLNQIK